MASQNRIRVQLRWRDLDQLGHVNQSVYHEFLEQGRGAAMMPVIELAGGFHFVLARVELDYRHEIRFEDREVELHTEVTRVGRSSITLAHRVLLPSGTLAAEGTSVLVAWDMARRASRPLTDAERAALAA